MNECINRNSIYNKLQALFNYWLNSIESQTISISYAKQRILPMIMEELPAADVAPVRHGRWEKQSGLYSCSECGKTCPYDVQADVIEYWTCNYCPHCGAKMYGGNG